MLEDQKGEKKKGDMEFVCRPNMALHLNEVKDKNMV